MKHEAYLEWQSKLEQLSPNQLQLLQEQIDHKRNKVEQTLVNREELDYISALFR